MPAKTKESVKITHDQDSLDFIASCKSMSDDIEKLREEMEARVSAFFSGKVKFIFEKCPWVESISWTQYTPGFCDGDPCEFSSNHKYFSVNSTENEEREWNDATPAQQLAATELIQSFMAAFDSDDMYDMFGNDVRVTATKDGIETDHYDCGY